jgi:hypothetical protein
MLNVYVGFRLMAIGNEILGFVCSWGIDHKIFAI